MKKICWCVFGTFGLLALFAISLYFMKIANGESDYLENIQNQAEITAYRGSNLGVAGVTKSNIRNAAKNGADKVSVDAQISRDGIVYLCPTTNLLSLIGKNANVWELDYKDVSTESTLNTNFFVGSDTEYFLLLADAIAEAQSEGLGVIIDVSTVNYHFDNGFERVIDVISQSGYADRCEVGSHSYNDIARIKSIDSTISTVYIAGIAFGSFDSFEAADAIAIEPISISRETTSSIHALGKKAYGWCLESENSISEAIGNGIDNAVTSKVSVAKRIVDNFGISEFSSSVLTELKNTNQ